MFLQLTINILEGFADINMACLSQLLPKSIDTVVVFCPTDVFSWHWAIAHRFLPASVSQSVCSQFLARVQMYNTLNSLGTQNCVTSFEILDREVKIICCTNSQRYSSILRCCFGFTPPQLDKFFIPGNSSCCISLNEEHAYLNKFSKII